mgnify:CR=1 FL=1
MKEEKRERKQSEKEINENYRNSNSRSTVNDDSHRLRNNGNGK